MIETNVLGYMSTGHKDRATLMMMGRLSTRSQHPAATVVSDLKGTDDRERHACVGGTGVLTGGDCFRLTPTHM